MAVIEPEILIPNYHEEETNTTESMETEEDHLETIRTRMSTQADLISEKTAYKKKFKSSRMLANRKKNVNKPNAFTLNRRGLGLKQSLKKKKILVVDDSRTVRNAVKRVYSKCPAISIWDIKPALR